MTMVERVARAICCAHLEREPSDYAATDRDWYDVAARAAIKAVEAYEDEAERDAARDPNDPRAKFADSVYVAIDVSPMGFRPTAPGHEARYNVSGGKTLASAPKTPAERDLGGEG